MSWREHPLLRALDEAPLLPVLRAASAGEATGRAAELVAAGFPAVELTTTVPDWPEALTETLRACRRTTLVGLGTVTTAEQAELACAAGAAFLVSPYPAPAVRLVADQAGVLFLEGAFSPGEIAATTARGPVKVFPASILGPGFLKALGAVLPDAVVIPTGGLRLTDLEAWRAAGALAIGVGSCLGHGAELADQLSAARQLAGGGRVSPASAPTL
jgi:2-dehydro-3-deoxyphosphogluconate aldolase/(4S)-4-hydroxy-2-oxoglutarate aldolase